MAPECGEALDISDDSALWRRVKDDLDHLAWDSDDGIWRPRPSHPSNSFQFNPDLSTSWGTHLESVHDLGPEVATDVENGYTLIYELSAGDFRALSLPVAHTPQATEPPFCAHASVYWPNPKPDTRTRNEIRYQLMHSMKLVHGEPTQAPPPGA